MTGSSISDRIIGDDRRTDFYCLKPGRKVGLENLTVLLSSAQMRPFLSEVEMNQCVKCRKVKPLSEFSKTQRKKVYWCKVCHIDYATKSYQKELKNNPPWYRYYGYLHSRCDGKSHHYFKVGIKSLLTMADLKYMWFRDEAYNLKRPTLSRFKHDKHYTIDNCKFIEFKVHLEITQKDRKRSISQYDLKGNFIRKWKSAADVIKYYGEKYKVIYSCLGGRSEHSKGYKWKYDKLS